MDDSDMATATTRLPESDSKGEKKKRKQSCMDSDLEEDSISSILFPLVAVIPGGLDEAPESVSGLVPYTAGQLSFIDGNGRKLDKPMPSADNIVLDRRSMNKKGDRIMFLLGNGKMIIFDPFAAAADRCCLEELPSVYPLLAEVDYVFLSDPIEDAPVAFAFSHAGVASDDDDSYDYDEDAVIEGDLIIATATPGDSTWSLARLSYKEHNFYTVRDVVFHRADGRFYAIDHMGHLMAFRVTRSSQENNTSVICDISALLLPDAKRKQREDHGIYRMLFIRQLVSHGSYLFQLRPDPTIIGGGFEILRYCHVADAWIGMTNVDLGNNSIFMDLYGAKLLPCCTTLPPPEEEEEGRRRKLLMRRNCIYFIHYKSIPDDIYYQKPRELTAHGKYQEEQVRIAREQGISYQHVDREEKREPVFVSHAKIYDLSTSTEEECFPIDMELGLYSPSLMWFVPSSSPINN